MDATLDNETLLKAKARRQATRHERARVKRQLKKIKLAIREKA